ncbi:DUF3307 domain-containing protein [Sphingobacterium sp. UT-1RO-CII-1]|uniref:DUF3307 domain-containing protein n=1 Tax=Sphingobacterium sp. UT-1RO-CII-1 TaxID=2995225 RepID=UPI00227CD0FD|nr:DUF3307 domain-containing protein [Sphingobacterium sp. UT-1RO-CII-1]MCY4781391.1 DUF3307 domain-containing protein [Sphingobacterium sp. UT-1RO-CII-1]
MILLFLKLFLAHILGDFVFQNEKLNKKKNINALYLLLHITIHGVLLFLFFASEWREMWQTILFILSVHLLVDSLKSLANNNWPNHSFLIFCVDQAFHCLALLLVVIYWHGFPEQWFNFLLSVDFLLYVISLVLIVFVCPVTLKILFGRWNKELEMKAKLNESLFDAGWVIGIIERILIVLFIQVGFLSGIGFLLAAKSIFRFGDLNNTKDTKFTEYVLIGTFSSFLFAIIIGYLLKVSLLYLI